MKYFIKAVLWLWVITLPSLVSAIGLGNIEVSTILNEPLVAKIPLITVTTEELDTLGVKLAGHSEFSRTGIERSAVLSSLKFEIKQVNGGSDYIEIRSINPIREPYLNFLVEVFWSKGRLLRQYTVLLDPPVYATKQAPDRMEAVSESVLLPRSQKTQTVDAFDSERQQQFQQPVATDFDTILPTHSDSMSDISYSGGDYGPVQANETLWSVAQRMRTNPNIGINQMMLALFRANPDAFIRQNINGLKKGAILKMPAESEFYELSLADAFAEAKAQNDLWWSGQGRVPVRPIEGDNFAVGSSAATGTIAALESAVAEQNVSVAAADGEAQLKLVSPDSASGISEQSVARDSGVVSDGSTASSAVNEELILAQESIIAMTQQNIELKARLDENEVLIEDLRGLIAIRDNQLRELGLQTGVEETQQDANLESLELVDGAISDEEEAQEPVDLVLEQVVSDSSPDESEGEVITDVTEEPATDVEPQQGQEEIEQSQEEAGIMGLLNTYTQTALNFIKNNTMLMSIIGGVILFLGLIVVVVNKIKARRVKVVDIEIPDNYTPAVGKGVDDSEGLITEILGSEEDEGDATDINSTAHSDVNFIQDEEGIDSDIDEEALPEVNAFIAFEQYDEAESMVKTALEQEPDNLDYHLKLLEVYYSSGNKRAYEEAAQGLSRLVEGSGDYWEMALAMWAEMSPNRKLFEEGGGDSEENEPASQSQSLVDITTDDEVEDQDVDFDIGGMSDDEGDSASDAEDEELDMGAGEDTSADLDIGGDLELGDEAGEDLDIGGDLELGDEAGEDLDIGGDLELGDEAGEDLDIGGDLELGDEAGEDLDIGDDLELGDEAGEDLDIGGDLELGDEAGEDLDIGGDLEAGEDTSADLDIGGDLEAGEDTSADLDVGGDLEAGEDTSADLDIGDDLEAGEDTSADLDIGGDLEAGEDTIDDLDIGGDLEAGEDTSADLDIGDDLEAGEDTSADLDIGDDLEAGEDTIDDLDIGGDLEAGEDTSADLDIGDDLEAGEDTSADLDIGDDLEAGEDTSADLDIGDDLEAGEDTIADLDIGDDLEAGEDTIDDLDIGGDLDNKKDGLEKTVSISSPENELPEAENLHEDTIEIPMDEPEDAMDKTMQMPSLDIVKSTEFKDSGDGSDEDNKDSTPSLSTGNVEEEMATKLDLAKAYVELGDQENARLILDEVIASGNPEQKKQAEDLLGQI